MRCWRILIPLVLICSMAAAMESRLPFSIVFKGQDQFNQLVAKAKSGNWQALPIGERTAAVGQALVGTRYKHFTLEIDNRIESPSVNFQGVDCWTFFEIALGFARMLNEPESNWTPERLLHYIELDRYRGGQCTGEYLSRLHYLEDWLHDNDRRGLVEDLTRDLGGRSVPHSAREMSTGWRHYRYHWSYFAGAQWPPFNCARRARITHERRRFALHAGVVSEQLRARRSGRRAFEISVSLSLRQR